MDAMAPASVGEAGGEEEAEDAMAAEGCGLLKLSMAV